MEAVCNCGLPSVTNCISFQSKLRYAKLELSRGPKYTSETACKDIVGTAHDEVLPTQDYINPLKVQEYKTIIQNGGKVAPSEAYLQSGKIYLEEGHHRFVAYKQLGIKPPMLIRNTGGPVGFPNWLNTTYQLPPFGY